MIADFGEIKQVVQEQVLARVDHRNLNDVLENPTAENIARWIWEVLEPRLPGLSEVRLYEIPDSLRHLPRAGWPLSSRSARRGATAAAAGDRCGSSTRWGSRTRSAAPTTWRDAGASGRGLAATIWSTDTGRPRREVLRGAHRRAPRATSWR